MHPAPIPAQAPPSPPAGRARETADTVVVGAGPAGLAVGACLRREGQDFVLLEREAALAPAWRRHYDRLHLHTDRDRSALPHLPLPRAYPRYPSRQQLVDYLEAYARAFSLAPRCGVEVTAVRPGGGGWEVETPAATYGARAVVIATGWCAVPVRPGWPGLQRFRGPVLHSGEYRSGEPFRGKDVLVVGYGNSGGEIAVDLVEHGARPALAVRGPVHVVPRDLLGLPLLTWTLGLSSLPPRVADAVTAPLLRLALGDLRRLGLRRPRRGPLADLAARGRVPVLDAGTLALLRSGQVRLRPGVARFSDHAAAFDDGSEERFDAVVLATGWRPDLARLLPDASGVLDAAGRPLGSGRELRPGLFLCGFRQAATGQLREIALEARRIARAVARRG